MGITLKGVNANSVLAALVGQNIVANSIGVASLTATTAAIGTGGLTISAGSSNTPQGLQLSEASVATIACPAIRPTADNLTLTVGGGRNAAGTFSSASHNANSTSGYKPMVTVLENITPASGSGIFAALEVRPTINGVSSGNATALAVASLTNTLTGGTVRLLDVGTTTQDYGTGFTRLVSVDSVGTLLATASAAHQIGTGSCGIAMNPNTLNLYGSGALNLNHSTAMLGARLDCRSASFSNFTLGTAGNAYLSMDMSGFGAGIMSLSRVCGISTVGTAEIGGVLNVNTTAVGNFGASGPDDLITYSMPGGVLGANGHSVRITAWGTTANNANAKTVRLMFGGTALVTKQLTVSVAGTWKLTATVVRTGASTQKFYAEAMNDAGTTLSSTDGATVQRICSATTSAETDTSTIVIKCQSTVSTSDNDIVNQGLITEWI